MNTCNRNDDSKQKNGINVIGKSLIYAIDISLVFFEFQ